jgi:argininosuccinate lyase
VKIWQKNNTSTPEVERFTVGKDRELDVLLAPFDVLGSLAHAQMLAQQGLMNPDDLLQVQKGLKEIYQQIENGAFSITEEDVHSQVEMLLTQAVGDAGKRIHTGRSRNDQVLLDLKLYFRHQITAITGWVKQLFDILVQLSEKHKNVLLPGYTHLQVAMPSSFGLWFGAYAESLIDDLLLLQTAYKITNKNPLGSAAGYGSSFPLNRTLTTQLLGFETLNYNVVYAQMGRGKTERIIAQAMAAVAATLSRMAMDICLYMSQNFGFVTFPDELTTGSSIMPHKKNPDVFELVRANCNLLQALPNDLLLISNNLPSGYHRDMQLTKEVMLPAFQRLQDVLQVVIYMLPQIQVNEHIITSQDYYRYLFSVEEVNQLVQQGVPFRDAYRQVGIAIEQGNFQPDYKINHTHEGSISHLCNDKITAMMQEVIAGFQFEKVEKALRNLLA